jgi:hypothetical protein
MLTTLWRRLALKELNEVEEKAGRERLEERLEAFIPFVVLRQRLPGGT